jgi:hypothetical protein
MTEAMIRADINHRAFRVLAAVLVLRDFKTGECKATNDQIAAACGVHVSHVQRDIKILVDAGLLDRAACGPKRILTPAETAEVENGTPAETAVLTSAESAVLTPAETADLHYYRDIQSIQSCTAGVRAHVRPDDPEVDRVAIWAGNYAHIFDSWVRAQAALYPIAWIEAAVDKAMGAGVKRPSYAKTILESWQNSGGPPAPAPAAVAPAADAPAPPSRRFETYKQRAKREHRERFLAKQAEINRRLDEQEAANAAM